MMTSRERVRAGITFQGPDRVPLRYSALPGARMRYGEALEDLLSEYPCDVRRLGLRLPTVRLEEGYLDHWGTRWQPPATREYLGMPVGHPLGDLSALENFQWPDPLKDGDWGLVKKEIAEDNGEHYLMGDGGNFFEVFQWLRGYENALCDLATGEAHGELILDRILDHNLKRTRRFAELGVDGVGFGDDWGTQQDLMISPDLWRRYFKPRYKKMFDAAREYGAFIHFHSDGNVTKVIPDFVELGVNVLNIQLPVMDMNSLSEQLKGVVNVRAGLDRQQILPFGTPGDVRRHVRDVFDAFGSRSGGWIGGGEIGPDVPLENARAMFEAIRDLM